MGFPAEGIGVNHKACLAAISMPEHLKVIDLFPHTCVLWMWHEHCTHWKSQDRKEPRKTRGCPRTTWPLIENQWPSWEFHIQLICLIWIHVTSTLRSPVFIFLNTWDEMDPFCQKWFLNSRLDQCWQSWTTKTEKSTKSPNEKKSETLTCT